MDIRDHVTKRDKQTNEQGKIELLSQWKLEAEFRKNCTFLTGRLPLQILRKFVCYFYAKYLTIIQAYTYCVNLCATFMQNIKCMINIKAFTYCVNLGATFTQNVCFTLFWRELGHYKAFTLFCRKLANIAIYVFFAEK